MNGTHASGPLDATVVDLFDSWAAKTPDGIAAEWQGEVLTYGELRNASLRMSEALLSAGVPPRARVPLLTQMSLEMLPAVIGILRIGACYAPMDVAVWGSSRVEAALSQLLSPVAVVTTTCPGIQLPVVTVNSQKEWLHSPILSDGDLCRRLDALRSDLRADDLAWIIFTSGTTGKPKGVMIYHSAIYAVTILDHGADLEAAVARGIRCLLAFSVAFDGCAAVVWTTLTKGGTLAMASPSNFPDVAASCDLLHLTPSMLAILDPSGPYQSVRYIFLGAEAPKLDVVRQWITPDRKVFNTYGPSETTCIISYGELKPDEEPPFGNPIPGVKIALVDENLQECDHGEVLINGPGLAAGYLNNPEMTAEKFIQWNGERFYRTGDLARRTHDGQFVWAGRADSLVKNRGFLINLETEVEPAMLSFSPVRQAVAVKWQDWLVGCVQPAIVDVEELRRFMIERFDPFIVPDKFLALEKFPLNVNGKTDRRVLETLLEERTAAEDNDMSLARNSHRTSAYDALRMAFSLCLHVPFRELNKDSSFTGLGGNSLAAIRFSNILKEHGHSIAIVQTLKLDTIGRLESTIMNQSGSGELQQNGDDLRNGSKETPATDVQKAMLTRSLKDPLLYALIGTTKYIGDPCAVPTAGELRDAFVKAVSAHSIFRTRFNLDDFTLSELEHRDLDWREVSVAESEFENACAAAEDKAWVELNDVKQSDIEMPYFRVTCFSVPDRKALAFVTRVHHALTDVFSSALFLRDVERALAGENIPPGPRFKDYARFICEYKRQGLDRAVSFFEDMIRPLPTAWALHLPKPRVQPVERAFSLVHLKSPTTVTKSALTALVSAKGITASTLVYAAWSLFLAKISKTDRVGFSLSLSGRMIPWPSAQDIVGPLTTRAPFSAAVPNQKTVHEWLADIHEATLGVFEFDGLMHSLPESLMRDSRTKSTCVLCLLDVPQPSTKWSYSDKQEHQFSMMWYVFQDSEGLKTEIDFHLRQVDRDWAEDVKHIPGEMLAALVNITEETLVKDLLR
ncbi:hypothetical protein N0V95_008503 [Ascochyta clinopodiicola]|nr:hypothetical protein N0V95_008503 [Ascochyta clinopodiicola]